MKEFSRVAGYKINIQKSISFSILTMNYQKIKKTVQFIIAPERIKYKENLKYLYTENYQTLMRQIEKRCQ